MRIGVGGIGVGWQRLEDGGGGAVPGAVFDSVPMLVGYGFHAIDSTWATGVVRYRRDSDNAEIDILADDNFEVTLSATNGSGTVLGTWCGANDALIVTRYNQGTGGATYDQTQSTTARQPRGIAAGVLVVDVDGNGKAAMDCEWTPASASSVGTGAITLTQDISAWSVNKADTTGTGAIMHVNSTNSFIFRHQSSALLRLTLVSNFDIAVTQTDYNLYWALASGVASELGVNGAAPTVGNAGTGGAGQIQTGARGTAQIFDGIIQTQLLDDTDQSANKAAVETILNDYFAIY